MHIDHININAPIELLETLRDFYCTILDLADGFRPEFRRKGFWLYAGKSPLIHLTESNEHYKHDKQGYLDHIAFKASGIEKTKQDLDAMGVKFTCTTIPELGMTQLFFKDPAGLGVELNYDGE